MRINEMGRRRALKRRRKMMPAPVRISNDHTESMDDHELVPDTVEPREPATIPGIPLLQREPEESVVETS